MRFFVRRDRNGWGQEYVHVVDKKSQFEGPEEAIFYIKIWKKAGGPIPDGDETLTCDLVVKPFRKEKK